MKKINKDEKKDIKIVDVGEEEAVDEALEREKRYRDDPEARGPEHGEPAPSSTVEPTSEPEPEPVVEEEPEPNPRPQKKPLKDIPPGSICPFLRTACIRDKCALWVGEIAASEDNSEQKIRIDRCGFVFGNQLQMNSAQLLALLVEGTEEEATEEDLIGDAYNKILDGEEMPKLDLDF